VRHLYGKLINEDQTISAKEKLQDLEKELELRKEVKIWLRCLIDKSLLMLSQAISVLHYRLLVIGKPKYHPYYLLILHAIVVREGMVRQ
jgi:hypothetical protein